MQIIRQAKGDKNCGQCTVAMITGKPLAEIIEKYGHNTRSGINEAKKVLNEYGYETGKAIVVDNRKKYTLPPLAFLRVEPVGRKVGHFLVHNDGMFYDSSNGVFNTAEEFFSHYKNKNWRLRHYVEIKRPIDESQLIASGERTV